ncbi:hypothetical protein N7493_000924, partial [Penicillium malachiteum]
MGPSNLFISSLNFTRAETFSAGFYQLVEDRFLPLTWLRQSSASWSWDEWSDKALQWLSRPGGCSSDYYSLVDHLHSDPDNCSLSGIWPSRGYTRLLGGSISIVD